MKKQKIIDHFKTVDKRMYALAVQSQWLKTIVPRKPEFYFESLCKNIVGQQLSGKAADTIWGRVLSLFPKNKITPQYLLTISVEELRNKGTSYAKANYLRNISEHVVSRKLDMDTVKTMSDESAIAALTSIKGVGKWTAEMFLMFTLGRENIFSHGDAGLQKALRAVYGLSSKVSSERIDSIVQKWSPYKTYACLLLWESLEK